MSDENVKNEVNEASEQVNEAPEQVNEVPQGTSGKKMLSNDPPKNTILAVVLSLVVCCIPGIGQFYLGQNKKGIILLVAGIIWGIIIGGITSVVLVTAPLGPLVCFVAAYEAWVIGKKLEAGEAVEEDEWAIGFLNDMFNK